MILIGNIRHGGIAMLQDTCDSKGNLRHGGIAMVHDTCDSKGNIRHGGIAMVQDPCDSKDRSRVCNHEAFHFQLIIYLR